MKTEFEQGSGGKTNYTCDKGNHSCTVCTCSLPSQVLEVLVSSLKPLLNLPLVMKRNGSMSGNGQLQHKLNGGNVTFNSLCQVVKETEN